MQERERYFNDRIDRVSADVSALQTRVAVMNEKLTHLEKIDCKIDLIFKAVGSPEKEEEKSTFSKFLKVLDNNIKIIALVILIAIGGSDFAYMQKMHKEIKSLTEISGH